MSETLHEVVTEGILIESEELLAMRVTIFQALRRVEDMGRRLDGVALGPHDKTGAYDLGRLAEALFRAESAVFEAVNVARNYCECPAATEALRRWFAEQV